MRPATSAPSNKLVRRKSVIEFKDVTKIYDSNGTKALDSVNIKIEDGEFVFVVGASGAGKSTFLKLIMHEEKPTEGEVIVNGYSSSTLKKRKVPYYRRTMGIVFQDFRIIPKMTVYDNVAFAMRVIGAKEAEIRKRVPYILNLVGLSKKARSRPNELSGGEAQRVSLARALVNNPDLIIADEPTGNVDPEMSHEIVDLLTKINNSGTTVVMVTHEHELVRSFQRRVIVIQNGAVVSDTPDPTFAKFKSQEQEKITDMFYYEEDVKQDNVSEVFDNLEEMVNNIDEAENGADAAEPEETAEVVEAVAEISSENQDGGEQ